MIDLGVMLTSAEGNSGAPACVLMSWYRASTIAVVDRTAASSTRNFVPFHSSVRDESDGAGLGSSGSRTDG